MVSGALTGDEKLGAVKLMFVDVKKAHLNGRLYGMRPAASVWEDDYVEHIRGEAFSRERSAPTVMLHE